MIQIDTLRSSKFIKFKIDKGCSTASGATETKRYEWILVQEFDSHDDLDDFLLFKIPNSVAAGSRSVEIN